MPDFLVKGLEIKELWGRNTVVIEFEPDVNILVGRNGTGKTAVLNLLNAVLTCNIVMLGETDFKEMNVRLANGGQLETINVHKESDGEGVEYTFGLDSGMHVSVPARGGVYRPSPYSTRSASRRMERASEDVRQKLAEIVDVRWLSVHRMREREREREEESFGYRGERMPAVDAELEGLLKEFAGYQHVLGNRLGEVSKEFQRRLSLLMLYDPALDVYGDTVVEATLKSQVDRLAPAFTELGVEPSEFRERWKAHVKYVTESQEAWRGLRDKADIRKIKFKQLLGAGLVKRTERLIQFADDAQQQRLTITGRSDKFLELCNDFFEDKSVDVRSDGQLFCSLHDRNEADEDNTRLVEMDKLSSGEKQLLIMLIETLVQRNKACVFMTDEPEISLHLAWQGKVLSSIRELNPNSQMIVATHSPEIVSDFGEHTIDMEDVMEASADAKA